MSKLFKPLIAAALAATLTATANAEELGSLVSSTDQFDFYALDRTIEARPEGRAKGWVRIDSLTDDSLIRVQKDLHEYDCTNNQMRTLYIVLYDDKGGIINAVNNPLGAFSPVIPGSAGEHLKNHFCATRRTLVSEGLN